MPEINFRKNNSEIKIHKIPKTQTRNKPDSYIH